MDDQRTQLVNDINQTLIELNHVILDSYYFEDCYSNYYEIITDRNTIVLSLKVFYENGNALFDEITIYDYDGNNLLLEVQLCEKHTSKEIHEIILSYFKS